MTDSQFSSLLEQLQSVVSLLQSQYSFIAFLVCVVLPLVVIVFLLRRFFYSFF